MAIIKKIIYSWGHKAMNINKLFSYKKILAGILALFLSLSTIFAQTHFSGFSGVAGNIGATEEGDGVQFTADTFFAGQIDLFNTIMIRTGVTAHTENLISRYFFNTVPASFVFNELSATVRIHSCHITPYISFFAGEYDSIGSDLFLRRHFGILPFASRLTENLTGVSNINIYPFSSLGGSYVMKLKTPQALGLYFYAGDRNGQLRGNVDFRFAGVFPFVTIDFSAGIGFPIDIKEENGETIMSLNRRIEFHTGLSTLIGNTHTASLLLQFGFTKIIINPEEAQKVLSLSDLYFWVEPRFKAESMNFHFTMFSIPEYAIQDKFYLSGNLGANLAIFANNIYAGSFLLTIGSHLTISTKNVVLDKINDISSENMSFRVSPFIETPFLEGMLISRFSIDCMQFEKMHTSIKVSLGYTAKL